MQAQLYALSIAATAVWMFVADDAKDLRTAVALFLNWIASVIAMAATDSSSPWPWFILIDGLTVWAITRQPAGKVQAVIGWLLIYQIGFHMLFGLEGNPAGERTYLAYLNLAGWLQVAALVWGAWHDGGRKVFGDRGGLPRDLVAHPKGGRGLEKRRGP